MKYRISPTAKRPATYIPVYVNTMVDYILADNYGLAKELAMELKDRVDETDWRKFGEWLKEDK